MSGRFVAILVIAGLVLSLVSSPSTSLAYSTESAQAKEFQVQNGVRTINDRFAEVAQQVPGFGGLFYDQSGQLTMYLVRGRLGDKQMVAAAKASVVTAFANDPRITGAGKIRVIPGKYDFLQLKQWYDRMNIEVLSVPGVVLTDIDEMNNRLRVGVENQEVQTTVEEQLSRLGVPREAVIIEVTGPFKPTATLQQYQRPLVGGLQISYAGNASLERCTLGFIAVRSGVMGMVVNSHCTKVQGGVDNTVYHQPNPIAGGGNRIALETVDPLYVGGGDCPAGRLCRWSDAAFARIPFPTGTTVATLQGSIARTTGLGSIDIDPANPRFRITSEVQFPLGGEILNKVGRMTGWTQGKVSQTCTFSNVGSSLGLYCQDIVNATMDVGDSGAPVFSIRYTAPVHSTVSINSKSGWQQTTLTLQQGKQFGVSYNSGTWTVDTEHAHVGPEGHPPNAIIGGCEVDATWPYGRLLGRIGVTGQLFSVGRGGTFTANGSGNLYLRINDKDSCLADNDGSVSMTLRHVTFSNAVYLYGIAWGSLANNTKFVFSAMDNIQGSSELGELETCVPNLQIPCRE